MRDLGLQLFPTRGDSTADGPDVATVIRAEQPTDFNYSRGDFSWHVKTRKKARKAVVRSATKLHDDIRRKVMANYLARARQTVHWYLYGSPYHHTRRNINR